MNPSDEKLIREILLEKLSPWLIYLFGSAAQGRLRPDSDIDIAFYSDADHNAYDVFMVAQKLADKLGREVDLVDLRHASEVFRAEIVGSRKVLYEADKDRRHWFEMRAFRDYALLNERRQPILDKICERGSLYD